jgi:predicted transcriptional regulator
VVGDDVTFIVTVANYGNVPENISLNVDRDWVTISKTRFWLIPGDVGTALLIAHIPKNATGTLTFTVSAACSDNETVISERNETVTISLREKEEVISMEPVVWGVVGGVVAFSAVILFGTEVGLFALLSLLMPVYSRVKGPKILDNFLRGQIYGYIRANPGASFNQIKNALGLHNGVFAYHLKVLMREKMIRSRRDGIYTRFYPFDMNVKGPYLDGLKNDILHIIRSNPGITQKEIARMLGISTQLVNYHCKGLREMNLITMVPEGRYSRCYVTER